MIRRALLTLLMILTFAGAAGLAFNAGGAQVSATAYQIDIDNLPDPKADDTRIERVLNVTFGMIGGISLIMVAIGGFKYINSQGDAKQAAEAKSTLIYAMIGLIISILGVVIVTYVIGRLT